MRDHKRITEQLLKDDLMTNEEYKKDMTDDLMKEMVKLDERFVSCNGANTKTSKNWCGYRK